MSVKTSEELKGLQVRRDRAAAQLAQIGDEMKALARRQSEAQKDLNALQQQINAMAASDPIVSEHALLRYLERVQSLDLDRIRQTILTPERINAIKFMRNGRIALPDGHTLIVKDRTVVTVE